jgi:uncharacterized protein (TIGR00369 family)
MNLLDVIRQAKAERDFNRLEEVMPYAQFLGLSAEEQDGEVVSKLAFSDMLIGNPVLPALHGGVVGALVEHAAIIHLMWEMETAHLPKTITITIDYLRSGRARDTFAKGIITKQGRRVANVRVEAWQDDREKPIAHGQAHFLLA